MAVAWGEGGGIMEVSKTPKKKEEPPYNKNGAELYAGTFQKNGKTYAAMVMIRW